MAKVQRRNTLQVWKDVIFALFLREIRSKFNDKFGISWAVIQPVSFIFILSFLRGRIDGGETHSMPSFVFIAFGMINILFFISTFNTTSNSIKKNKSLFAFRQVQPISSLAATAILELIVKITVILFIVIIIYFLGIDLRVSEPLSIIINLLLVWTFASSLGLIFALASCFVQEFDKVRQLAQRPLFFISGTFFTLQDIPSEYWKYFDWNPILHSIELSRQAAYPSFGAVGVSQTFVSVFTLFALSLALAVYHVYWKQAISR